MQAELVIIYVTACIDDNLFELKTRASRDHFVFVFALLEITVLSMDFHELWHSHNDSLLQKLWGGVTTIACLRS